jgi:hypothetical protein
VTQILGRRVDYLPVSAKAKRETLLGYGVPAWIADMLVEYAQAYAGGWGDFTTSDFLDVVGHPPRGVDDFIRDYLPAFFSARLEP